MTDCATLADPVQNIISHLEGVRECGPDQWSAKCPSHDDRRASLSIGRGEDGRALLKCHAGCSNLVITKALGLPLSALMPPRENRRPRGRGGERIVACYDYRDEGGALLFQVVRFDPKDFRQRRPDGDGWAWNLDGVRRVLYRLPQLLQADRAAWVFVVEGEKDADALAGLGLAATCNPGGAGKWGKLSADSDSSGDSALEGRRVAIIPDADPPGQAHAADVARRLHGRAAALKILALPGGAKDAADWIAAGGTADALVALAEAAPPVNPEELPLPDTASGKKYGSPMCTDLGNADRLASGFSDRLRYVPVWGWMVYDGRRWYRDDGAAAELAKKAVRDIFREAASAPDDEAAGRLAKWATKSQGAARLEAMLKLARSDPAVAARPEDFDRDPWLLNVANGTVDLRTGRLRGHSASDMLTRCTSVAYNQSAVCPRWFDPQLSSALARGPIAAA